MKKDIVNIRKKEIRFLKKGMGCYAGKNIDSVGGPGD